MFKRNMQVALICCVAVLYTGKATAQTTPPNVTFEVPLNLTRLHNEIEKVSVRCSITSNALNGHRVRHVESEVPVSQGAVTQIVQVTVNLTDQDFLSHMNPSGQTASHSCELWAFNAASSRWGKFRSGSSTSDAFALTPAPTALSGSFVW